MIDRLQSGWPLIITQSWRWFQPVKRPCLNRSFIIRRPCFHKGFMTTSSTKRKMCHVSLPARLANPQTSVFIWPDSVKNVFLVWDNVPLDCCIFQCFTIMNAKWVLSEVWTEQMQTKLRHAAIHKTHFILQTWRLDLNLTLDKACIVPCRISVRARSDMPVCTCWANNSVLPDLAPLRV